MHAPISMCVLVRMLRKCSVVITNIFFLQIKFYSLKTSDGNLFTQLTDKNTIKEKNKNCQINNIIKTVTRTASFWSEWRYFQINKFRRIYVFVEL